MQPYEAILLLQAIIDDSLDPDHEGDAKRIEAVELAIDALRREAAAQPTGDER